jgi:5-methylcytosine-specific restriction endonuclease McrA
MKKIWTDDQLRQAVPVAKSLREVCSLLGLRVNPKSRGPGYGSQRGIRERIRFLGIDTSHFKRDVDRYPYKKKFSLEELLTIDSPVTNTSAFKKRLIKEGVLENICILCGIGSEWNHKPLVLQIDHINGDREDNRLENLRILCPNCHSQTETYVSRNKANGKMPESGNGAVLKTDDIRKGAGVQIPLFPPN